MPVLLEPKLIRDSAGATVQINNEQIIATEWRFSPGAETAWYRHSHDYIVIPIMRGKPIIEGIIELEAGKSYYRSANVRHNVINANNDKFVFVEIELKSRQAGRVNPI